MSAETTLLAAFKAHWVVILGWIGGFLVFVAIGVFRSGKFMQRFESVEATSEELKADISDLHNRIDEGFENLNNQIIEALSDRARD
jgi:hypothetical protein